MTANVHIGYHNNVAATHWQKFTFQLVKSKFQAISSKVMIAVVDQIRKTIHSNYQSTTVIINMSARLSVSSAPSA